MRKTHKLHKKCSLNQDCLAVRQEGEPIQHWAAQQYIYFIVHVCTKCLDNIWNEKIIFQTVESIFFNYKWWYITNKPKRGHCSFHMWELTRTLCCVRLSLSDFSRRVKVPHSAAPVHYGLSQQGSLFFSFFSSFFSKCSIYWLIEIQVLQLRYDKSCYLPFNLHLFLFSVHFFLPPHFRPHSSILHLIFFFMQHVISLPPVPRLHLPHLLLFFSSVSAVSSPLLPCSAGNGWNRQLQNSDQPLCGVRKLAKLSLRLINTPIGCS